MDQKRRKHGATPVGRPRVPRTVQRAAGSVARARSPRAPAMSRPPPPCARIPARRRRALRVRLYVGPGRIGKAMAFSVFQFEQHLEHFTRVARSGGRLMAGCAGRLCGRGAKRGRTMAGGCASVCRSAFSSFSLVSTLFSVFFSLFSLRVLHA